MSIAEQIIDVQATAVGLGIKPAVVQLGPVKYRQWRRWVRRKVPLMPVVPDGMDIEEYFQDMKVLPTAQPGIIVGAEP
jgi:hypothetical protein